MGLRIGVIGATGYVGEELVRILCKHPHVASIDAAARDYPGSRFDSVYPHLRGHVDLEIKGMERADEVVAGSDLIFLALPHGLSAPFVKEALKRGKRVIDLAADFRLPEASLYEEWYKVKHEAPELLGEAVYGLPELFRSAVREARLVANPGCYPTSALLALAPLLRHGLVELDSIIIDSKSGVSGAGRALALSSHFSECNESVRAYSVGTHRHTPEIAYYASVLAGEDVAITFTPHLIPMTRGILSTVYARLIRPSDTSSLRQIFQEFYKEEVFVEIAAEGEWPQTNWVRGTNRCYIGVAVNRGKGVIVVSAIDNLVKGAAGQAVQNMNIMYGLPETAGLDFPGLYL
ncbi:MAG: N-acetyl-gamma-glutamyl-phosphate reductase [Thermacetogeniaceae bacterium]